MRNRKFHFVQDPFFPFADYENCQTEGLFVLLMNGTNYIKALRCTCLNIWFYSVTVAAQRQRELTQQWRTNLLEFWDEETCLDRGSGSHYGSLWHAETMFMQEVKIQSISQAGAGDEAFQEKKLGRKSPPMRWLLQKGTAAWSRDTVAL